MPSGVHRKYCKLFCYNAHFIANGKIGLKCLNAKHGFIESKAISEIQYNFEVEIVIFQYRLASLFY